MSQLNFDMKSRPVISDIIHRDDYASDEGGFNIHTKDIHINVETVNNFTLLHEIVHSQQPSAKKFRIKMKTVKLITVYTKETHKNARLIS
jgi:D-Tyr-tRNAtyr deacylase